MHTSNLNNIFLDFHRKILKIKQVTVNLRRRFEKKLFCGVHYNSQRNHLKQKNQNAFIKGDVSRGELCEEVLCKILKRLVQ